MNALRATVAAAAAGAFLAWSSSAQADAGALSLEFGGGASLVRVRAPYATGATETGTTFSLALGASHALTNGLELGAQFFFEPPEQFVHDDATIVSGSDTFRGSLVERTQRIGGLVRARKVFGLVWQPLVGLDVGWSHRSFSRLDLFDVRSGTARSFGLQLPDAAQDALLVAPVVGLRWSDDHLMIGVAPRFEMLIGTQTTWAVTLPLTVAWAWYL